MSNANVFFLFSSDLLQCTNEPNVSIPQLADLLIERTQHGNWVVVYKSLISIHNMMNYGNEVRHKAKCRTTENMPLFGCTCIEQAE